MTAVDHAELLDLADSDGEFRARVVAGYTGRHDPEDALRWYRHPLEPSSAGSESPSARLAPLERLVFSARERSAEVVAAERQLRDAEAAIARDRADVEAALESAFEGEGRVDAVEADAVLDADLPPAVVPSKTLPRRVVFVGVLVVASITLLAVGAGIGGGLPKTDAAALPSSAPSAHRTSIAAVLAKFDTAQVPDDIPAFPLSEYVLAETTRRVGFTELRPPSDVYIAKSISNRICLIAIDVREGVASGYASTCVSESSFPADGLRVGWAMSSSIVDPSTNATTEAIFDVEFVLHPDGTSEGGSARRP